MSAYLFSSPGAAAYTDVSLTAPFIAEVSDKILLPSHTFGSGLSVAVLMLITALFAAWRVWPLAVLFGAAGCLIGAWSLFLMLVPDDPWFEAVVRQEQGEWYRVRMLAAFMLPTLAGAGASFCLFRWQRSIVLHQEGRCGRCAYDLRGLVGSVCPECGRALRKV